MATDEDLAVLAKTIHDRNGDGARQLLAHAPGLATYAFREGATRQSPQYWYTGDTALHMAAAAHDAETARALIAAGANVHARNRRGGQALHYAAMGQPGQPEWNGDAQAATVRVLIEAGAEVDARNMDDVTPLHRAVRTRSAPAVRALIEGGANVLALNGSGSTPMDLATRTTGRGGSGSPEAKAQQVEIIALLKAASPTIRPY